MNRITISAISLIIILLSIFVIIYSARSRQSFELNIDYDRKSRQLYVTVTNLTDQEIVFDVHNLIRHELDWRLCSTGTVICASSQSQNADSLVIADHFPVSMHPHEGLQANLTSYFPKLENVSTNLNVDHFLWYFCLWDSSSHKWIQKFGQITFTKGESNSQIRLPTGKGAN